MALASTQPLTEMRTRDITLVVKTAGVVCRAGSLSTFMCPTVKKSESLNLLEPYGPVQTSNGMALHAVWQQTFRHVTMNTAAVLSGVSLSSEPLSLSLFLSAGMYLPHLTREKSSSLVLSAPGQTSHCHYSYRNDISKMLAWAFRRFSSFNKRSMRGD